MHNNVNFLNMLSSNAYEFDKREMRFHLRKSVVTFAKKIIEINHSSRNIHRVTTSVLANVCFKKKIV